MLRTLVTLNKLPPNLSFSFKYLITLDHTIGRCIAIFQDGKLLQCIQHFLLNGQLFNFNIYLQGMFHAKTGFFFLTYTVFITNENAFKMVTLLNTYSIILCPCMCLLSIFPWFFRGWTGVIKRNFISTNTYPPRFTRYRRISWSCVWNWIYV